MKKFLLAAVVFIGMTSFSMAQAHHPAHHRPAAHHRHHVVQHHHHQTAHRPAHH